MKIAEFIKDLNFLEAWCQDNPGKKIALVPTMGALHEGHLSLIDLAKKEADLVVVSIFVNKLQFNDTQDFANYPKNLALDLEKLKSAKVDLVFVPRAEEIYPKTPLTQINLGELENKLCGKKRPGHFAGMALIVTKLFNLIRPNVAIFGEKDFQQLQIIRHLVLDLNFPIRIIGGAIKREKNGLAMSSRNLHLSSNDFAKAGDIFANLKKIKQEILSLEGQEPKKIEQILQHYRNQFLVDGFDKIDYLEVCRESDLKICQIDNTIFACRLFIAIYLGGIRLIDNISFR